MRCISGNHFIPQWSIFQWCSWTDHSTQRLAMRMGWFSQQLTKKIYSQLSWEPGHQFSNISSGYCWLITVFTGWFFSISIRNFVIHRDGVDGCGWCFICNVMVDSPHLRTEFAMVNALEWSICVCCVMTICIPWHKCGKENDRCNLSAIHASLMIY